MTFSINSAENPETSETLYIHSRELNPASVGWWKSYKSQLDGLSPTAKIALEADSNYIVSSGIFGAGKPGLGDWPESRIRRGIVMGSVQSGKTASMFGVTAMALDEKVDLVIILAGTRLSLWRQTYRRLQTQLDVGEDGAQKERKRLLVPKPGAVEGPAGRLPLSSLYNFEPAQVRRAIRDKRPIVVVAMKHGDHLRALGKSIRDTLFKTVGTTAEPFHMLVLDDEADDGSILDANVEEGLDQIYGKLKQIPRAIADLWDSRAGGPAPINVYSTYVAYTATPQANFLQQDHNPLAPKDFVASLRTSYDRGNLEPRETTYFEPKGLHSYYTGGEIFYRRGEVAGLCVPTGPAPDEDRDNAVRAFLVASAIRQARRPHMLGPQSARTKIFESREEAAESSPEPRSMLIHPSAVMSDHHAVALNLLGWAGQTDAATSAQQLANASAYLPDSLFADLESKQTSWRDWLDSYTDSAKQLETAFDSSIPSPFPNWEEIEDVLRAEIIPGTRVSVVNSDPDADDRPEYEPWRDELGWHAPRDLSTIFISGNVMSRGLTLEGLTTTLFLRHSNQPFADSQMQMQRWFGYRGSYIELCRVIAPQPQLDLFASYHESDEALRQIVIQAMNDDGTAAPKPVILQGQDFLATGKIANLANFPLCPGAKPFFPLTNDGQEPDQNARVVASLFADHESEEVSAGGVVRGRILAEPLWLEDAARLLDRLRFDNYAPGADNWQANIWHQVQTRVEAQGKLIDSEPLYRPVRPHEGHSPSPVRKDCPYALAAYFRLWSACLTRHVRGIFPTEGALVPWSKLDLQARIKDQPRFWVGIRYGGGQAVVDETFADVPFDIRAMERTVRNGQFDAEWGSRNPDAGPTQYRGDEFFDYYHRGEAVPNTLADEPSWRSKGSDGLILFHINQPEGQPHPTVAFGACIPVGGPDQFAATVSSVRKALAA